MWKDMLGRDTSITILYGSPLNGILLQSWSFWILSMKKQINCIMRASILSLSAPHGSGEGTEGQTCWTHHTRAGWRLLSINLDFAAQGQGRNNYTVPALPEVLLAEEKWGVGGAQPAFPPWSFGLSSGLGSACMEATTKVEQLHTKASHKSHSVLRCSEWYQLGEQLFGCCFLPAVLVAYSPWWARRYSSFPSSHCRMRKACQSNTEAEKAFSPSGTSKFSPLHGFLEQMIKYYSSQHHHDRQSAWHGQGKEELVPYSANFIWLVLQVLSLQHRRQALCQSFNQAGVCPNLYWLVRPLHFLLSLSSVSQVWNSIYKKQECKKAWKPKLIRCCQVGALRQRFYFCHSSGNAVWVEFKMQVKLKRQDLLWEPFL